MKCLKMLGLAAAAVTALLAFASSASATTLEIEGVTQNKETSIVASLAPGTTATLVDEGGTTTDTCNTSEVKGETESPFTAEGTKPIGGPVTSLTFGGCSHTTDVLKPGKLFVSWIEGTTNGTVVSKEAEVLVRSTVFGINATCKTGTGTTIGTLTGVKTGHATMDIDATNVLDCGILGKSSWIGTYTVTSPTGLGVAK
jgi:hypothetical protein